MRAAEIAVVQPFGKDDVDHTRKQRGVFARTDREIERRELGDIAFTRIGHDQFQSAI